jgi:hypothetical protein
MPSLQQTAASYETKTPNQPQRNSLLIYEGDVIHHFKATELRYVMIAITFVSYFISSFQRPYKAACEIRDCKKKTQNSRGEKKMKQ